MNNFRAVSDKGPDVVLVRSTAPTSDGVGAISGRTRVCSCCTNGRNDDEYSVMSSVNACNTTSTDGLWLVSDGLGCFATFRHATIKAAREGVVTSLVRN